LKSAADSTTLLRKQFADGTRQFESYVEHVTRLSDEREAVAVEMQLVNNQLNEKIEQLTLQLACRSMQQPPLAYLSVDLLV